MTRSLLLRAPAEADILEAARWYEQRSAGLGSRFLEAVDVVLAEVVRAPLRFPLVHRDVRRALLPHYLYGLYFLVNAETVIVIACLHARRDPRRWQERSEGDR